MNTTENIESPIATTPITAKRIAFYLRSCGNLHYFAAIAPYLRHFMSKGNHQLAIVVKSINEQASQHPEYAGYQHLFSTNCDLDSYDLVVTPSFLRAEERTDKTRAVQIFHGMSDKPFTYERDFSNYIKCLCVGQRQLDRLRQAACNRTIQATLIGYPKFDNPPTTEPLFENNCPTIIYCPTWRKESISSIEIFLSNPEIIVRLALDYNLIIKPHPNIFNPDRQFYDQSIVDQLEVIAQIPNVKLMRSGNVMPWYAQADLFIGDISAAGYEWLYYNKPMVFLNPQPSRLQASEAFTALTYLWQCGEICSSIADLPHLVEAGLRQDHYQSIRESILHYSVFKPRDNGATRRGCEEIEHILAAIAQGDFDF
jgi:hypothetical protein